jgi:tyrosyl-tRNA synthetase
MTDILRRLARTTDDIVGRDDLVARLASGRPLRIKYGVDCTAPDLHIGHAVNLWMMRALQDLGHTVVFLLGDLTTAIGDPTGRSDTRPTLSAAEIDANAASFLDQVSLVLRTDPAVFEVRRNSEWYATLGVARMLELFSLVTHARLVSRDMFAARIDAGREIAMSEFTYPIFQGYDSVALRSDLTIVGSDQLFNEMMGRHFQERLGTPPQTVITTRITPGLDGRAKQSKSLRNYVALRDPAAEKFGKLMSLPDHLVAEYALVYTDLPTADVDTIRTGAAAGGASARDAKATMASAVVARYHGTDVADDCRAAFRTQFSERGGPVEAPEVGVPERVRVLDLLAMVRPDASGRELRRLVTQGAVWHNGRRLVDPDAVIGIGDGDVLKTGKRVWHTLRVRSALREFGVGDRP